MAGTACLVAAPAALAQTYQTPGSLTGDETFRCNVVIAPEYCTPNLLKSWLINGDIGVDGSGHLQVKSASGAFTFDTLTSATSQCVAVNAAGQVFGTGQACGSPVTNSGFTPMPHVPNNTALEALASTVAGAVMRDGYALAGDAPAQVYTASSSPCSLNSGAGDGGAQVPSADGNCWLANFGSAADVREWGAKNDGVTDSTVPIQNAIKWELNTKGLALAWPDGAFVVTSDIIVDIGTSTNNSMSDGFKWIISGGVDLVGTSITTTPTLEIRCGTKATIPSGCNNAVFGQGGRLTVKGSNANGPVVVIGLPPGAGTQDLFSGGVWDYLTPQNFSTSGTGCGLQINNVRGAVVNVRAVYDGGGASAGWACNGVEITGATASQITIAGVNWGGGDQNAKEVVIDGTGTVRGNSIILKAPANLGSGGNCLDVSDANATFNQISAEFTGCINAIHATAGADNALVYADWGNAIHYVGGFKVGIIDTGAFATANVGGLASCSSTCTLAGATNVASVVKSSAGHYTVNFNPGTFTNTNFTFECTPSGHSSAFSCEDDSAVARSNNSIGVVVLNASGTGTDPDGLNIRVTGN